MKIHKKPTNKLLLLVRIILVAAIIVGSFYLYNWLTEQSTPVAERSQLIEHTSEDDEGNQPELIEVSEAPARITIDKIGVDASIETVGLTADGMMDAPKTNHGVGWYDQSSELGGDEYSMLLDGHYGTDNTPAVFYRLAELSIGDTIDVQGDGGTTLSYQVVETDQQLAEDVDMERAMYPYSDKAQSLTIITCEGLFDSENVTYDERTIIYAERVT